MDCQIEAELPSNSVSVHNGSVPNHIKGLKCLQDITESTKQVTSILNEIKEKVESGLLPTDQGISLLGVKNKLLTEYITDLVLFILRKISGKEIESSPMIDRLIENRVVLERMKPLEQKIKYQIDKLLRIAVSGSVRPDDPANFRANPDNMASKFDVDDSDSEEEVEKMTLEKEAGSLDRRGIYVPPKLAAVPYDGDETKEMRNKRLMERARKHALNSSVIEELKEEYLDTPVEVTSTNSLKQREDRHQKRIQEYEETYFTRLPVTKEDKRRQKQVSTLGRLGDDITRFEDISALELGSPALLKSSKKRKAKHKLMSKGRKKKKKKFK